jgi:hypothetical protein
VRTSLGPNASVFPMMTLPIGGFEVPVDSRSACASCIKGLSRANNAERSLVVGIAD